MYESKLFLEIKHRFTLPNRSNIYTLSYVFIQKRSKMKVRKIVNEKILCYSNKENR